MVFVKNCSIINSGYEYFETMEDLHEWKKGNSDAIKVLDTEKNEEMQQLNINVEQGFLRVKKKDGTTISIPFTRVFVNGEKTTISKLFRRYWYNLKD
jgi:hypothetical protein